MDASSMSLHDSNNQRISDASMNTIKQFEGLISNLTRTAAGMGLGIYVVKKMAESADKMAEKMAESADKMAESAVDVANVYAKNGGALPLNHYSDNGIVGRPGGSKP